MEKINQISLGILGENNEEDDCGNDANQIDGEEGTSCEGSETVSHSSRFFLEVLDNEKYYIMIFLLTMFKLCAFGRMYHECQGYISQVHGLQKIFVSPVGIQYQALVDGTPVSWFAQDIDRLLRLKRADNYFYRYMIRVTNNILEEFNEPVVQRLRRSLNANPSRLGSDLYSEKRCYHLEDEAESELRLAQLQLHLPFNGPNVVEDIYNEYDNEETRVFKNMFKNFKFFLTRRLQSERETLLFVITAFGGLVSWDGEGAPFPANEMDITHQVVGRRHGRRIPPPQISPFTDNELLVMIFFTPWNITTSLMVGSARASGKSMVIIPPGMLSKGEISYGYLISLGGEGCGMLLVRDAFGLSFVAQSMEDTIGDGT
ncbi:hypothetical protein GIB67_030779 [Kingdonia uniflora]|uniref:Uncharacterized protein n=1 Tax=Kingdonia uniflora TaxID=39325 RepID=A0A7J7L321_9MAGN|nr:hypothetical protein GIB67_030779 [Kingdonia uniflora]